MKGPPNYKGAPGRASVKGEFSFCGIFKVPCLYGGGPGTLNLKSSTILGPKPRKELRF